MGKRTAVPLLLIGLSALFFAWWNFYPHKETAPEIDVSTQISPPNADVSNTAPEPHVEKNDPLAAFSGELLAFGLNLRQQYAAKITNPYWQMNLIDALVRKFKKKYPTDWEERVRAMLRALFPELADSLLAKFAAYLDYAQWTENLNTQHFETSEERLRAAWEKRRELFGEDAELIWANALKQEQVTQVLQTLGLSGDPLPDKVQTYVDTLVDAYGNDALDANKVNTTELMSNFLQLASVQDDIHRLDPVEQREALRQFRTAMGLDGAALKRWDDLDTVRAQRRSKGEQYMELRTQLEKQYQGNGLDSRLDKLRKETFGEDEAQYLRNEEASGYYRFSQPQVIGVD